MIQNSGGDKMIDIDKEILHLVNLGWNQQTNGQYNDAYHSYLKALEYNPNHPMIRNALGKLLFIEREYLASAENFYIAAVSDFSHLNLDLIFSKDFLDKKLRTLKEEETHKAHELLIKYAFKTGFSLLAHQYDNPIARTSQQAAINFYRKKYDPYGYSNVMDVNPGKMILIEENATKVGFDFFASMNQRTYNISDGSARLEYLMKFFDVKY